ncbi:DUF2807 domain-containing protein [Rhodocytophaga rosea]|uniref:DUF2807 domain-containing protein n=1 Tax=Rhodocytophaga rosea TaxID=2704465 RepID=A0A6C0GLC0_9BACT|nr:head GIN domain-containing protein [Rhodocytophaga rosea]QHT68747.1 DUF2807 domain-containing protein [Rhodocytophaga rosea]
MKTSNKLILGFLTLILIAITVFVAVAKYYQYADTVTGNGKNTSNVRQVTDFNSIEVSGKISVNLTQGAPTKVEVKGDENLIVLIRTEVSGNQLRIYTKDKINRQTKIEVDVTVPNIESLHLSGGANIQSTNELKGEELALKTSSGSQATLALQYKNLTSDSNAGSILKLSGQVEEASFEASAGSIINAFDLNARKCSVQANAGSMTEVKVLDQISADISSGSSLTYDGEPAVRDVNASSGGMIRKK